MDGLGRFYITVNGITKEAITIMNFELPDNNYYCIYAIKNESNNYDIFCGQIIGSTVTPIQEDNELPKKITLAITEIIKKGI